MVVEGAFWKEGCILMSRTASILVMGGTGCMVLLQHFWEDGLRGAGPRWKTCQTLAGQSIG